MQRSAKGSQFGFTGIGMSVQPVSGAHDPIDRRKENAVVGIGNTLSVLNAFAKKNWQERNNLRLKESPFFLLLLRVAKKLFFKLGFRGVRLHRVNLSHWKKNGNRKTQIR